MLAHKTIRNFARYIIMNHDYEGMEVVLFTNGDYIVRQRGNRSIHENEVMVKIPLGQAYWGDSFIWGEDLEKEQVLKEMALDELIEEIYFRIEDWHNLQTEIKKFEEHFDEERKAYEDMIGL